MISIYVTPVSYTHLDVYKRQYKYLRSPYSCKNEYVNKIFDEYLGKQSSFVPEAGAFEEKHTGKVNSDRRSELSECFQPHMKRNAGVMYKVRDSLYSNMCSSFMNAYADKSEKLKNLKCT